VKELDRVAAVLHDRRRELERELDRLTATSPRDPVAAVSFGKRIGEGTTEAVERLSTTAVAKRLSATIAEIDAALDRVADGSYGTCERCGASIPDERLEAIPWAARCVSCAR
jgi:RNA polymerase-binding transcription factor DksA